MDNEQETSSMGVAEFFLEQPELEGAQTFNTLVSSMDYNNQQIFLQNSAPERVRDFFRTNSSLYGDYVKYNTLQQACLNVSKKKADDRDDEGAQKYFDLAYGFRNLALKEKERLNTS